MTGMLLGYVTLCFGFGGAGREGYYAHGVLQAIAAFGLAVLVLTWPRRIALERLKTPIIVLFGVVALGLSQIIPLPNELWQALPGRSFLVDGFANLGHEVPNLPISLDVEATLTTLCYVLTPLFVLLLAVRIGIQKLKLIVPWFFFVIAIFAVLMGLAQVFSGVDSVLYLYDFTSRGLPVGVFSNVNHQASLLLMALPFCVYLLTDVLRDWDAADGSVALVILLLSGMFLILVGVFAAGSVGGYVILVPVAVFTYLASRNPGKGGTNIWMRMGLFGALILGAILVASSPVLENLGVTSFGDEEGARFSIWEITLNGIGDNWLTGTGLGTYESVIPVYEDPDTVTSIFVAKAHNDYLQIVMEAGVIGGVLLLVMLIWVAREFLAVWGQKRAGRVNALRKFAFVSLLALLLHSIVDYPVRTPAIAAMLGLSLAVFGMPGRRPGKAGKNDQSNSKRVVL